MFFLTLPTPVTNDGTCRINGTDAVYSFADPITVRWKYTDETEWKTRTVLDTSDVTDDNGVECITFICDDGDGSSVDIMSPAVPEISRTPSQNDRCPCGSTKKYKQCCGVETWTPGLTPLYSAETSQQKHYITTRQLTAANREAERLGFSRQLNLPDDFPNKRLPVVAAYRHRAYAERLENIRLSILADDGKKAGLMVLDVTPDRWADIQQNILAV